MACNLHNQLFDTGQIKIQTVAMVANDQGLLEWVTAYRATHRFDDRLLDLFEVSRQVTKNNRICKNR
jgi:hypothetical protein